MSLINDALKRASQAERNRPRESSLPAVLQPARPAHRSNLPWLTGVVVIILLTSAGWLIHLAYADRGVSAPGPPVTVSPPAVPAAPPLKAGPIPASVPAPVAAPAIVTPPVAAPVPPAPVAVVSPSFPELKLQGILYSRNHPKIFINGETLGENESIGGVQIVKIFPGKVTVQWNGQTKDLQLKAP